MFNSLPCLLFANWILLSFSSLVPNYVISFLENSQFILISGLGEFIDLVRYIELFGWRLRWEICSWLKSQSFNNNIYKYLTPHPTQQWKLFSLFVLNRLWESFHQADTHTYIRAKHFPEALMLKPISHLLSAHFTNRIIAPLASLCAYSSSVDWD